MSLKRSKAFHFYMTSLIAILGLLSAFVLWQNYQKPTSLAHAQFAYSASNAYLLLHGNAINSGAYAWSNTFGWLSFGGTTEDNVDYGVKIDPNTGIVMPGSFAWSSNLGWIAFSGKYEDGTDIEVCPGDEQWKLYKVGEDSGIQSSNCTGIKGGLTPTVVKGEVPDGNFRSHCNASCTDCLACYNKDEHKLYGWAFAITLGKKGWIALDGLNSIAGSNVGVESVNYDFIGKTTAQVDANNLADWGHLKKYAWGGYFNDAGYQTTGGGLGLLSFNCANDAGCETSNYLVSAQPAWPLLASVPPTTGFEDSSLTVNWRTPKAGTDASIENASWFEVWRRDCGTDTSCVTPADYNRVSSTKDLIGSHNIRFHVDYDLTVNNTYAYRVLACNIFGCNISNELKNTVKAMNLIGSLSIATQCRTAVNEGAIKLNWTATTSPTYELQYCQVNAGQNENDCLADNWHDVDPDSRTITGSGKCVGGDRHGLSCTSHDNCKTDGGICLLNYSHIISGADYTANRYKFYIYRVKTYGTGAFKCQTTGGNSVYENRACTKNEECCFEQKCENRICKNNPSITCTGDSQCPDSSPSGYDGQPNCGNWSADFKAAKNGAHDVCKNGDYGQGWLYSKPMRLCPPGGIEEQRSQ